MYKLCVKQNFISQHALIGGDWGQENFKHSHHFVLEVRLGSSRLNEHGYVCDIVRVKAAMEEVLNGYRDRFLNELPPFAGLNPSVENFARILGVELHSQLPVDQFETFEVRLWEDQEAWVSWIAPLR